MFHWKATLTYDGTPYNGWQIQPCLPTVQGTFAEALHHVTGEIVLPQGSGRTDTGVHALAQVASFTLTVPIPGPNLLRALNHTLPPSIRVLSIEPVPPGFHARHSAQRKTYEYRIFPTGPGGNIVCSPMLASYVWAFRLTREDDLATLQQTAPHVIGTHDFTSFAAVDPDQATRNNLHSDEATFDAAYFAQLDTETVTETEAERSQSENTTTTVIHPNSPRHLGNIRTIYDSTWHYENGLLIYRVTGSGFLHHMVRNLVGTFVAAAQNRINPNSIPAILAACDRSAAGPTAPASGLFLVEVIY
jgi:tRNA pseudouridine38-40 synthase